MKLIFRLFPSPFDPPADRNPADSAGVGIVFQFASDCTADNEADNEAKTRFTTETTEGTEEKTPKGVAGGE
jgi:hypothetical protein